MQTDECELPFQLNSCLDEIMQFIVKLREILAEKAGPKRDVSKLVSTVLFFFILFLSSGYYHMCFREG